MKGKQERRQQYAGIDLKRTQRFGTLCSAFQALQMPVSNLSTIISMSAILSSTHAYIPPSLLFSPV